MTQEQINELRKLAQAATPGAWVVNDDPLVNEGAPHLMTEDGYAIADFWGNESSLGLKGNERNAAYIAAANPAAVLELIAEVDRQRGYADDLTIALESSEKQLKDSRANDYTAMGYLADCRMAVGDNGKRMLPEFVEYLRQLKQQRDELLAALKDARELVDDWGAYAPAYIQEKHDLAGDLDRLYSVIAKAESQS